MFFNGNKNVSEKKFKFSIRKYHFGAASVVVGTLLFLGGASALATNNSTTTTESTVSTQPSDSDIGTTENSSSNTTETNSQPVATNNDQASPINNVANYSLSGYIAQSDGSRIEATTLPIGDTVAFKFNIGVSAPDKLSAGSVFIVDLNTNDPIENIEVNSAGLKYEIIGKQIKFYVDNIIGGESVSVAVSYNQKTLDTASNSITTITGSLYPNGVQSPVSVKNLTVTNTVTQPKLSLKTSTGSTRPILVTGNYDSTAIAEAKPLEIDLISTNREKAATTNIKHEVLLPENVTLNSSSVRDGWKFDKSTRIATFIKPIDPTTEFNNVTRTSLTPLRLDISRYGTLSEFLSGKQITIKDKVTYTDKSGEISTEEKPLTITIRGLKNEVASNTTGENGGSSDGSTTPPSGGGSGQNIGKANLQINNEIDEPVIPANTSNQSTNDYRTITILTPSATPSEIKYIKLNFDSDYDQHRSLTWTEVYVPSLSNYMYNITRNNTVDTTLPTSQTFYVFGVNEATGQEEKIGEMTFSKTGNHIDIPDQYKSVVLRPKGLMEFDTENLSQVRFIVNQYLTGLTPELIDNLKKGEQYTSTVIATLDDGQEIESKTTTSVLAETNIALKLSNNYTIKQVIAGNNTSRLPVDFEVYDGANTINGYRRYAHEDGTSQNVQKIDSLVSNSKLIVEIPDGFTFNGEEGTVDLYWNGEPESSSVPITTKVIYNYNGTGKNVVEITGLGAHYDTGDRRNTVGNSRNLPISFKVHESVPTGNYDIKYTWVWDEKEYVGGLNPNPDYEGTSERLTNTTSATYSLPVLNTARTLIITKVESADNPTDEFVTTASNLLKAERVNYKVSLSNQTNIPIQNNTVLVTLPTVGDKLIVNASTSRGSQFAVSLTGEVTSPAGWTALYTTEAPGTSATATANKNFVSADAITNWSLVRAVKFVSNSGVNLSANETIDFILPAVIANNAQKEQRAVISAASAVDGETTYNEGNLATITIRQNSGEVRKIYRDEQGNILNYFDENNDVVNTVIVVPEGSNVGTSYTTTHHEEIITSNRLVYVFKEHDANSAGITGSVTEENQTVVYIYKAKEGSNVVVEYYTEDNGTLTKVDKETVTLKPQGTQVGTYYETTSEHKKSTITIDDGSIYKYNRIAADSAPESGRVSTESLVIKYIYTTDKQQANIKYVLDSNRNTELATSDTVTGNSNSVINYSTSQKISEILSKGYRLVNNGFVSGTRYDNDTTTNQEFIVTFEETYKVEYEFVSGTEGKELPQAIKDRLIGKEHTNIVNGEVVNRDATIETVNYPDETNDGVWKFRSWDKETETINKGNGKFVGTWDFIPNKKDPKSEIPTIPSEESPYKPDVPVIPNKENEPPKPYGKLPNTGENTNSTTGAGAAILMAIGTLISRRRKNNK